MSTPPPTATPYLLHALSGVVGSSQLLTRTGAVPIQSVVGQPQISVWNGWRWVLASVYRVMESQPVYEVTLSDGRSLTCGADYPWYIRTPTYVTFVEIKTQHLVVGSALWWTTLETDREGAPPASFPTIASVTLMSAADDLYCVTGTGNGLVVLDGILGSEGYRQPDVAVAPPAPTPAPPAPTPAPTPAPAPTPTPAADWILVKDALTTAGVDYTSLGQMLGDLSATPALSQAIVDQFPALPDNAGYIAYAKLTFARSGAQTLDNGDPNLATGVAYMFGCSPVPTDLQLGAISTYADDSAVTIEFAPLGTDGFYQQSQNVILMLDELAGISTYTGTLSEGAPSRSNGTYQQTMILSFDSDITPPSQVVVYITSADGTPINQVVLEPLSTGFGSFYVYYGTSYFTPPLEGGADAQWMDHSPLFGNLTPGEVYYVYVAAAEAG